MLYALLACSLKTAMVQPPVISAEVQAIGIAATVNENFGRQLSHARAAQSLHYLLTPGANRFARLKRGSEEHIMILQQGTVHPLEPEYHLLGDSSGQNKTWQATLKHSRSASDFEKIAALEGSRVRLFEESADLGLAQELSTKKALHQLINDVAEKESLESNRVLMGSITIMALEHTITPTGVWTDLIGHISFEEPENSDQELAMLHLDYAISEEKKGNLKLAEESYLEAAKLQPDDERVIMATAEYHWRQQNIEQSLEMYLSFLEKNPSNYDLMEEVISRCKSARNRGGDCYERIRSLIPKVEKPPEPVVNDAPTTESKTAPEEQGNAQDSAETKPVQQQVKAEPSEGSQSESQPSAEAEEASTNNTGSAEENASVEKIESGDNESDDAQENGQSNDGESERAKLIEAVQEAAEESSSPVIEQPTPSQSTGTEN